MNAAKWLANFTIGGIILLVSLYFVISLCVAFFKLTGQLIEGEPMYLDLQTPTWMDLLIFQAACVAILGVGFFLRRKLQRRREQLQ
jgi:uncharacterized membrane protein